LLVVLVVVIVEDLTVVTFVVVEDLTVIKVVVVVKELLLPQKEMGLQCVIEH
jgi:hypothetical protein